MAAIAPLMAIRYPQTQQTPLIAPPYDVIDPALQELLYQRSPYNVVRLILNRETAADSDRDNRYTRAAQTLRDWVQDGILVQDSARALYVYHQDFEVEGRRYTRRGFLARVRLERAQPDDVPVHGQGLRGRIPDKAVYTISQ